MLTVAFIEFSLSKKEYKWSKLSQKAEMVMTMLALDIPSTDENEEQDQNRRTCMFLSTRSRDCFHAFLVWLFSATKSIILIG